MNIKECREKLKILSDNMFFNYRNKSYRTSVKIRTPSYRIYKYDYCISHIEILYMNITYLDEHLKNIRKEMQEKCLHKAIVEGVLYKWD